MFNDDKKCALSKQDKSLKGRVDAQVKGLLDLINSDRDYYTTSSCAGRVMLIKQVRKGRAGVDYIYVSHEKADFEEIIKILRRAHKQEIWFRQEEVIIHVACRNLDAAKKLLQFARGMGLKHSGIISVQNKTVVEVISNEKMNAIVAKKGRLLVSHDYLKVLVDEANSKMKKNMQRIKLIEKKIKKIISPAPL